MNTFSDLTRLDMNSINTTVEKSNVSTTERSVSSLLLVRRINQFLSRIGRALSLSAAIYTK